MRPRLTAIIGSFLILAGCGQSDREASAEFDAVKLRTLLNAIRPSVTKGLGDQQVQELENSFRALAVDETKHHTFAIVHDGIESQLRISVRKEDVDVVEIRFSGNPKLADEIQQIISRTPLD